MRGLLAHRKRGRWGNTQENVFILLALDRYFQNYEAQTPDFVARVWLGEQYVAGFNFVGRTTEYQTVRVPMAYLAQQAGEQDLILSKRALAGCTTGWAQLRAQGPDAQAAGAGLYRAAHATRRWMIQPTCGRMRTASGTCGPARGCACELTMVAPTRRYHVALVDPLPAGFEAINPALAVSGSIPQDAG